MHATLRVPSLEEEGFDLFIIHELNCVTCQTALNIARDRPSGYGVFTYLQKHCLRGNPASRVSELNPVRERR